MFGLSFGVGVRRSDIIEVAEMSPESIRSNETLLMGLG